MIKVLIVKGNKFQVAKAAAERNIPFAFKNEVPTLGYSVGLTSVDENILNEWMVETSSIPFPIGALMAWSRTDEGELGQ